VRQAQLIQHLQIEPKFRTGAEPVAEPSAASAVIAP
jgi:hypothetical protein